MRRFAWLALALCAACGPGSYRDFRDQLIGASCDWGVRCGVVTAGDRAHCPVDQVLGIFHDAQSDHAIPGAIDVAASIDAGRMRYDSVNAQSCLDAVADAPCEPLLAQRRIGLGCNAVVAAHTETDRPCWGDAECTGGVCARAAGCAGICAAYAPYGAPCTSSMIAPASMRCDPTVAFCGPMSVGGDPVCQSKKPEGATCDDTIECSFNWTCRQGTCTDPMELDGSAACGGTDPCNEDSFCNATTGLCEKRHPQGESCASRYGCEDNLGCIGYADNGAGTVIALGTCAPWLPVGAACTQVTERSVSGCPDSAPCTNGVCTATESLAARDEDCSTKACAQGLLCNTNKRCDWVAEVFGDCGGDRATVCDPALTCMSMATDYSTAGVCVPMNAPACFQPVEQ